MYCDFLQSADLFFIFSLLAHAAVALPFVQRDKRKQKHALHRGPKEVIITVKVFCSLFFSTISAHLCRYLKSVLIGDYSISAPCFSGGLFRTSLFKTALFYCDRYFLLLPRFLHFALLSAPVYSLLAPVVAIGCFSWFIRGWFCYSRIKALHICVADTSLAIRQTSRLQGRCFTSALRWGGSV